MFHVRHAAAVLEQVSRELTHLRSHQSNLVASRRARVDTMNAIVLSADACGLPKWLADRFDELHADVEAIDEHLESLQVPIRQAYRLFDRARLHLKDAERIDREEQALVKAHRADVRRKAKIAKLQPAAIKSQEASTNTIATKTRKPRRRWREWGSNTAESVELVVSVVEKETIPDVSTAIMVDDVERRGNAFMSWAPWSRRRRYSRRYEGFAPSY